MTAQTPLTDQQAIMLGMAIRLGDGQLWMAREDGGVASRYYGEIVDLEHKGFLAPPQADPAQGVLRWRVTEAGRRAAAAQDSRRKAS